jgi:hypothetical protein
MKTVFTRKNKILTNLETGNATTYKSINEAKKASRKVQIAHGGLGRGSLVVL